MIQLLSVKYQKLTASLLLTIFYTSFLFSNAYSRQPTRAGTSKFMNVSNAFENKSTPLHNIQPKKANLLQNGQVNNSLLQQAQLNKPADLVELPMQNTNIGGPSQPEMSSFKSVGTANMVNLFTGDFNYNIPLLDVGGYPVNIFYDASIGMEQEASWVGLGWNINPGNINRNTRGVPDDFNGDEQLNQVQVMKPNKTWGVKLGADIELVGIKNIGKLTAGVSYGVSVNNYLGPALELGASADFTLKSVADKQGNEKASAHLGIGADLSSRNGLTISPYASLSGQAALGDKGASIGTGLRASTSFNSRSGIKSLQLSEQMSFNKSTKKHDGVGGSVLSTSISFAKPSYIPTMRMKITNSATAGRFQLGGAIFGIYASAQLEGYGQVSKVADEDIVTNKPMVGYLHYDAAKDNPDAVMDFTRFNDNEVMPSTPIIAVPQYSYDVFSIQGEGTGGSIRAYRNDLGYVRDNLTESKDKSIAAGLDIGIPGHVGGNFSIVKTPTSIGEWKENNLLKSAIGFKSNIGNLENVYFRNPGETSVLNPHQFDQIGGTELVRFKLGGSQESPSVEPKLERFSKLRTQTGITDLALIKATPERKKRTQVISFLTAGEAKDVGLDQYIKNYNSRDIMEGTAGHYSLKSLDIPRVGDYRGANHISEIDITESNGKRYIYGIPVYNTIQRDFTFSVNNAGPSDADKVPFIADDIDPHRSQYLSSSSTNKKDGYLLITTTPAYAHSFLLTGLLSNDYVDVTGNGITEDDLGTAVKFNYTQMQDKVKWRTPLSNSMEANFNPGKRTEVKDDKGIISYGERESWYVHSIESKSMIALFTLEGREDGKGAGGNSQPEFLSGVNSTDDSKKRLKKIDLYNKADLKKNGLSAGGAKPVKTVWFDYDYRLCQGTPDHPASGGKLTLTGIHFTYNGKRESSSVKDKYVFSYAYDKNADINNSPDNPSYEPNGSDRWGTYKHNSALIKNADYPYTTQIKAEADKNAGAWTLKKILLPSGGQVEVTYESDDYAFVQNKRAAAMMTILGFSDKYDGDYSDKLYKVTPFDIKENNYVLVKVPTACSGKAEVLSKYLKGIDQVAFKLAVIMPKSGSDKGNPEFITSYATIDADNYDVYPGDNTKTTIWIKLKTVDGFNPLSLSAIEFLRQELPGQAYKGYDVSESSGLKQQFNMLMGLLDGLVSASIDPVNFLRVRQLAQEVALSKSFVRLNSPDGHRFGGGHRVKSIILKDNWKAMKSQLYTSEYGQEYDYTTTEVLDGITRTISSGVASYEPSLGGDENPLHTMWQFSSQAPLGPANYGAVELPVLDAFFPSPLVGYSKVTVRSIKKEPQETIAKLKSGIGRQVSEFYTAKDFPVYYNNTPLDVETDRTAHASSGAVFYNYSFDSRAISQGFIVETNDMHGKMKSQASYAQNDDKTPINYTENFYKNTGVKGLDETFNFINAASGGTITKGNMGVDIELMNDTREFSQKTNSFEVQAQLDLFPVVFPAWLPFIWPVVGKGENTYRAVTTTKVINYHSIVDRVVVIDKGSEVSTENLVYDAETGEPVVTRTNNEFNQPIYNTSYPAYWAYSGMGLAYKNIDATYTANFRDGVISGVPSSAFESGDELYLTNPGTASSDPCAASFNNNSAIKLWAFDKEKDTKSLTNNSPAFVFMDNKGKLYSKDNVVFRIIRSGKRNMLDAKVASIISMSDPRVITNPAAPIPDQITQLKIDNTNDVNKMIVSASAVDYKEKWQTDEDVFKRYRLVHDDASCIDTEEEDCAGYLEKQINPYVKGLIGNFKPDLNLVFYEKRSESNPLLATNISKNGFLNNFKLYWDFNNTGNLIPDVQQNLPQKWIQSSVITRVNSKGLELETKDALGIYTAAQYGYNKTMPVAIANNARYSEMFAEGFEDNIYDEGLHSSTSNCIKRHVDFLNFPIQAQAHLLNTEASNFKAHTGKYVMSVNQGTVSKDFDVTQNNYDFSSALASDVTKVLNDEGGVSEIIKSRNYSSTNLVLPSFSNGGFTEITEPPGGITQPPTGPSYWDHEFKIHFFYYIKIDQKGVYPFNLQAKMNFRPDEDIFQYSFGLGISLSITDVNSGRKVFINTPTPSALNTANQSVAATVVPVALCPGIYLIDGDFGDYFTSDPSGKNIFPSTFSVSIDNFQSPCYKSLSQVNNCTFTKPLAATSSMLNPEFSPGAGTKMLFSGWVNENCTSAACANPNYANSKVHISVDETEVALLSPVGPVIEGWQKVEGVFTLPEGAAKISVGFENDAVTPNYWDDIRIHPYNSNMKSYVYDPINLRLTAELDANNYATFYEYDEEGTLIRTKAETKEGIKTLTETRSAKQKSIVDLQ